MSSLNLQVLSISSYTTSTTPTNDQEPIICLDIDCTYPFGDACERCYFALVIERDRPSEDVLHWAIRWEKVKQWVEDVNVRKYCVNAKGRIFVAGADGRDEIEESGSEDENKEQEKDNKGQSSDSSSQTKKVAPAPHLSPNSLPTITSQSTVAYSPSPPHQPLPLSPWLNDLFDNTLSNHVAGTNFIGGAEDSTPIRDPCPFCFIPLGLEGEGKEELHLMKCRYAHEESERLELWMIRELEKGNVGEMEY